MDQKEIIRYDRFFIVTKITIHGKDKYELCRTNGRHMAYFNDLGEAVTIWRELKRD